MVEGVGPGSGTTINVVGADVAKDVDEFPGLRILFDVESEDVLERNVALLHCWSRKAIMSSIRSKVCTRPPAMARFAARSFSCHSGVQK